MNPDAPNDDAIRAGEPPVPARTSPGPEARRDRMGCGLVCTFVAFALAQFLVWGVITGDAFPILDSTGIPGSGAWVCPLVLLTAIASFVGAILGIVAVTSAPLKRRLAWSVLIWNGIVLAALVAFIIHCVNRGLMS